MRYLHLAVYSFVCILLLPSALFAQSDVFSPHEALTADTFTFQILQRNPDVQSILATMDAARQRTVIAGALDDPLLSYQLAPNTLSNERLETRQNISVSQKIPWFGKRALRTELAQSNAEVLHYDLAVLQQQLVKSGKILFTQWYYVHAALEINDSTKALLKEVQAISEIKYASGKVSKKDVLQAEMEQVLLQQQIIDLNLQKHIVLADMNKLLNRAPEQFIPPPYSLSESVEIAHSHELSQHALQQRPELKADALRIKAQQTQIALTDKNDYPDVNLSATYNGVMDPPQKRALLGISVNIPLQEKRNAAQSEAKAQLLNLQWKSEERQNAVQIQVHNALTHIQQTQAKLTLIVERLLPLAEETLTTARQDYESGRGDIFSLLNSEKKLLTIKLGKVQTIAHLHRYLAELDAAMGKPEYKEIQARSVSP